MGRLERPTQRLVEAARRRALVQGLEFNLVEDDLVIPDYCPILGIELRVDRPGFNTFSPSLDRIDSSRGYVVDNVQVISNRANLLKRDASLRELVLLGEWAKNQLKAQGQ